MLKFVRASPLETKGYPIPQCGFNVGTKDSPHNCGLDLYMHRPFEVEDKDFKTNEPFTKYFGYGWVCPQHSEYRVAIGY